MPHAQLFVKWVLPGLHGESPFEPFITKASGQYYSSPGKATICDDLLKLQNSQSKAISQLNTSNKV